MLFFPKNSITNKTQVYIYKKFKQIMNKKQTKNNKEKYFFYFLDPTRIDLDPTYFYP